MVLMASIASSETQRYDLSKFMKGSHLLTWPSQHPSAWEQQKCTMGEEQQSRMGTLWETLGLLFCLGFGCWVLVIVFVNWQSCVHHEYKETWQVINKRHYLGKTLNEIGVHFPVQQRLAFSGKEAKARKWAQRRFLPECLYVSAQQYWQKSESPSLSILWSNETWLYGDRTFVLFLGCEWTFLARRLPSHT